MSTVANDLASLDSQLRKLVICMCLDIEQMLKTRLIADASCIDSKGVVKEFVQENTIFFNTVYSPENMDHVFKRMTRDTTIEELSVSDFLEVIQFGTIERFVRFFYDQFAPDLYGKAYAPFERYLDSVRRIRNSSAHNNGLISELLNRQYKEEAFEKNTLVLSFLGKNGVRHRTLDTNMSKQAVHDLCCLIHMYVHFLPKELAKNTLEELRKFLQVTCRNNSAYYIKNPALISAHSYLSNVTDVYTAKTPKNYVTKEHYLLISENSDMKGQVKYVQRGKLFKTQGEVIIKNELLVTPNDQAVMVYGVATLTPDKIGFWRKIFKGAKVLTKPNQIVNIRLLAPIKIDLTNGYIYE